MNDYLADLDDPTLTGEELKQDLPIDKMSKRHR